MIFEKNPSAIFEEKKKASTIQGKTTSRNLKFCRSANLFNLICLIK